MSSEVRPRLGIRWEVRPRPGIRWVRIMMSCCSLNRKLE